MVNGRHSCLCRCWYKYVVRPRYSARAPLGRAVRYMPAQLPTSPSHSWVPPWSCLHEKPTKPTRPRLVSKFNCVQLSERTAPPLVFPRTAAAAPTPPSRPRVPALLLVDLIWLIRPRQTDHLSIQTIACPRVAGGAVCSRSPARSHFSLAYSTFRAPKRTKAPKVYLPCVPRPSLQFNRLDRRRLLFRPPVALLGSLLHLSTFSLFVAEPLHDPLPTTTFDPTFQELRHCSGSRCLGRSIRCFTVLFSRFSPAATSHATPRAVTTRSPSAKAHKAAAACLLHVAIGSSPPPPTVHIPHPASDLPREDNQLSSSVIPTRSSLPPGMGCTGLGPS